MRSRLLSKGRTVALANGIGPGLQRGSLALMLLLDLGKGDVVEILRPDVVTEAVLGGPVLCHASKADLKLEEKLSRHNSARIKEQSAHVSVQTNTIHILRHDKSSSIHHD